MSRSSASVGLFSLAWYGARKIPKRMPVLSPATPPAPISPARSSPLRPRGAPVRVHLLGMPGRDARRGSAQIPVPGACRGARLIAIAIYCQLTCPLVPSARPLRGAELLIDVAVFHETAGIWTIHGRAGRIPTSSGLDQFWQSGLHSPGTGRSRGRAHPTGRGNDRSQSGETERLE